MWLWSSRSRAQRAGNHSSSRGCRAAPFPAAGEQVGTLRTAWRCLLGGAASCFPPFPCCLCLLCQQRRSRAPCWAGHWEEGWGHFPWSLLPFSGGFWLPHSPASKQFGQAQGACSRFPVAAAVQPPGSCFLFLSGFTSHEGEPPVTHGSPAISVMLFWKNSAMRSQGLSDEIFIFVCLFLSWSSLNTLVRALGCLLAPGAPSSQEKPRAPFGTHLQRGGQQKGQKHSCYREMLLLLPWGSRPQPHKNRAHPLLCRVQGSAGVLLRSGGCRMVRRAPS